MRSSKSRSRSKNNRRPSAGNVVNRVFDSSGPEGKVRGTPQQIIDKYQSLARDAQLSNDRVAAENFLQHAEHYTRMLGEAQREQEERRLQQERDQQRQQQQREARDDRRGRGGDQPDQRGDQRSDQRDDRRQEPAAEARAEEPAVERRVEGQEAPTPEAVAADAGPAELARAAEAMAAGETPGGGDTSTDAGTDAGPIEVPEERRRTRRSRSRKQPAQAAAREADAEPGAGGSDERTGPVADATSPSEAAE